MCLPTQLGQLSTLICWLFWWLPVFLVIFLTFSSLPKLSFFFLHFPHTLSASFPNCDFVTVLISKSVIPLAKWYFLLVSTSGNRNYLHLLWIRLKHVSSGTCVRIWFFSVVYFVFILTHGLKLSRSIKEYFSLFPFFHWNGAVYCCYYWPSYSWSVVISYPVLWCRALSVWWTLASLTDFRSFE